MQPSSRNPNHQVIHFNVTPCISHEKKALLKLHRTHKILIESVRDAVKQTVQSISYSPAGLLLNDSSALKLCQTEASLAALPAADRLIACRSKYPHCVSTASSFIHKPSIEQY